MSEKLPNLWVHHQEELSANTIRQGIPESYSLSVPSKNNHLYIPAERIRELIEKWRHKADVKSPVDVSLSAAWDSAANQLEALIAEEK